VIRLTVVFLIEVFSMEHVMDSTHYLILDIKEQLDRIEEILTDGITTKTWLNIKEACIYTSLSVSTLKRAIAKGTLKASKQSGKILFNKKNLDRFLG
tara:strand:- start:327 stop:617 length:291 start_codon:yes stop_codon:yes gene_type:complete